MTTKLLSLLLFLPVVAFGQITYSSSNGFFFVQSVTSTNFYLTNPQWIDLFGQISLPSTVAPTLQPVTNGSIIQLPAYKQDDHSYWTFQLPHNLATTNASFVLGTSATNWHVEPHVHFSINSNGSIDSTHSNVTWKVEWEFGNIGGDYYTRGTNTATTGVTTIARHYLVELGAITNNGPWGISGVFRCRLSRPASANQEISANSSTRDVTLDQFDLHVPVGNVTALGSRDETAQ